MGVEITRNENLFRLINELINKKMFDEVLMLGEIIKTDTIAMKKSFSIIARNTYDKRLLEMVIEFENEIRDIRTKEDCGAHYNVSAPDVILRCMHCEEHYIGKEPQRCCDGQHCGCMGLPVEPVVCSDECFKRWMKM